MENIESKRIVRTFAWASFFNDFGSDMIYPVWPLFVTTVMGADMAVMGLIDGLGEAVVSISQAISGYLSDRLRKRKVFVWLGYAFGMLSRVGYAAAGVWQHLVPLKVLDRAGKMRGAPRDAIVADLSTQADRGSNFGLLRTMDNLGAFCGIIVCILLVYFIGYRSLFLIAAVPSAISVLLILFWIKEPVPGATKVFKGLRFRDLEGNFRLLTLLSAIFALGNFSYSFLMILAKNWGFKLAMIPVLYLIFTAAAAVTSWPFGWLSDVLGRKLVLMLGFVLWAVVCLVLVLFHSPLAMISGFILFGMHKGALETVQKAFVAELAPTAFRASALGGFQMIVGLCALPASLFAGLLWDRVNVQAPFVMGLGLTAVALLLLLFIKEPRKD